MWSGTQLLQGAIFAAIFVTSQCQPDSEPGTVGGGTGGATGDQGVVQPPARETTLPPYLFTTLTSYRSTPNKVPDTTRYRHTPGITPRATRMTDIPLITNKPSTIFPPGGFTQQNYFYMEIAVSKLGKYLQVRGASYLCALRPFQIFAGPLFEIKLYSSSTALLSGFQSSPGALKSTV